MTMQFSSRVLGIAAVAALVVSLAGCGGGKPSGVYKAKGQAIFEQFDFQSGDKVAVSAFGQVVPGDFVVMDDGRIKVMASNGGVATLKKTDDGCLEMAAGSAEEEQAAAREGINPGDFGRFCKD
jgi:hypothetical protein